MIDLKPYGAFIENTIRPLIDESHRLLNELETRGFPINRDNLKYILGYIAEQHRDRIVMEMVRSIVLTIIICITFYMTMRP